LQGVVGCSSLPRRITWSSDKDGDLGATFGDAPTLTSLTTLGEHTITATVTFFGTTRTASIQVTVVAGTPKVVIDSPGGDGYGYQVGQSVTFRAHVENVFLADCSKIVWQGTGVGSFTATGCEFAVIFGAEGAETVTATFTDQFGSADTATRTINIAGTAGFLVSIEKPSQFEAFDRGTQITLKTNLSDPSGTATVEWFAVTNTGLVSIGMGTEILWTSSDTFAFFCGGRNVTLIVKATDASGNVVEDSVVIFLADNPC
jgi:hypothetical protein